MIRCAGRVIVRIDGGMVWVGARIRRREAETEEEVCEALRGKHRYALAGALVSRIIRLHNFKREKDALVQKIKIAPPPKYNWRF